MNAQPLKVAVLAPDPERRRNLVRALEEMTEFSIVSNDEADVLLIDAAKGAPPPLGGRAALLLSDDSALRDSDLHAVLPIGADAVQIGIGLRAAVSGLFVRLPYAPDPSGGFAGSDDDPPPALLTPRELEVLTAIGEGLSNKAVARRLDISAHTVKFHLEAVFGKLDARTRAEAVAKGLRRGLIEV